MPSFKKTLMLVLVLISVAALTYKYSNILSASLFQTKQKAGIRMSSVPTGAQVFINNQVVGKTPYEDQDLMSEEYAIRLQSEQSVWQGKVRLIGETLTVINRDLSQESSSSAGETLTLEKGKGVTVISNPSDANIEIDGKDYGKTPRSADVSPGEHTFTIKKESYINRSIRATVPESYTLVIDVDLALSEADLTKITAPVLTETLKVVVKNTPTNFLRVREKPSLSSKEIVKLKPGDELILLEEMKGWNKIRLSNGEEGYVSSDYTEKKSSQ